MFIIPETLLTFCSAKLGPSIPFGLLNITRSLQGVTVVRVRLCITHFYLKSMRNNEVPQVISTRKYIILLSGTKIRPNRKLEVVSSVPPIQCVEEEGVLAEFETKNEYFS